MSISFRHTSAFGKRIEYYIVGLMLKQGLDVYLPLVDDDAIDAVVKKPDGSFVEVQIKARSKDCKFGNAALFAALTHEARRRYWFVFYSERLDKIWILSSKEFIQTSRPNKTGKNIGARTIWLSKKQGNTEVVTPQFEKYLVINFDRIMHDNPDA